MKIRKQRVHNEANYKGNEFLSKCNGGILDELIVGVRIELSTDRYDRVQESTNSNRPSVFGLLCGARLLHLRGIPE